MTPDEYQKADQASAILGDYLPPFWRRLYSGLIEQGFESEQAMSLLRAYINTSCRRSDNA